MSVLKKIQGKIESVQQDLSASIKSLKTTRSHRRSAGKIPANVVSYDAGSDLLNRYQEVWASTHTEIEASALAAQEAAVDIGTTAIFCGQQLSVVTKLHDELAGLTSLHDQIKQITNIVGQISDLGASIEENLVNLENICETVDTEKEKKFHLNQLEVYRLRRQVDLEKVRVRLANEHTGRVRLTERKRQAELSERHLYFEEAFNHDLEFYRIFGETERRPSAERKFVDLADIILEDDNSELDDFLGAVDDGETSAVNKMSSSEGEDSGIHNVHDSPTNSAKIPSYDCERAETSDAHADSQHSGNCGGHRGIDSDSIDAASPASPRSDDVAKCNAIEEKL